MKTVFADANIFIRFFTKDDRGQHLRADALLHKAAEGRIALVTGPPIFFEIAWTLRGRYSLPKDEILDVLARIRTLPGLRLTDAGLVDDAIALARKTGQEFADAYIAASMSGAGATEVATFNTRDFEQLGIKLHEF